MRVVVLNDGETFTGVDDCVVMDVPGLDDTPDDTRAIKDAVGDQEVLKIKITGLLNALDAMLTGAEKVIDSGSQEGCTPDLTVVDGYALTKLKEDMEQIRRELGDFELPGPEEKPSEVDDTEQDGR